MVQARRPRGCSDLTRPGVLTGRILASCIDGGAGPRQHPQRREPMKITDIQAITLAIPMQPMTPPSPWVAGGRKQIVVQVRTDEGLTGVGEAFAYGAPL